ncbi:Spherulin-1A [Apiospora arundinis]
MDGQVPESSRSTKSHTLGCTLYSGRRAHEQLARVIDAHKCPRDTIHAARREGFLQTAYSAGLTRYRLDANPQSYRIGPHESELSVDASAWFHVRHSRFAPREGVPWASPRDLFFNTRIARTIVSAAEKYTNWRAGYRWAPLPHPHPLTRSAYTDPDREYAPRVVCTPNHEIRVRLPKLPPPPGGDGWGKIKHVRLIAPAGRTPPYVDSPSLARILLKWRTVIPLDLAYMFVHSLAFGRGKCKTIHSAEVWRVYDSLKLIFTHAAECSIEGACSHHTVGLRGAVGHVSRYWLRLLHLVIEYAPPVDAEDDQLWGHSAHVLAGSLAWTGPELGVRITSLPAMLATLILGAAEDPSVIRAISSCPVDAITLELAIHRKLVFRHIPELGPYIRECLPSELLALASIPDALGYALHYARNGEGILSRACDGCCHLEPDSELEVGSRHAVFAVARAVVIYSQPNLLVSCRGQYDQRFTPLRILSSLRDDPSGPRPVSRITAEKATDPFIRRYHQAGGKLYRVGASGVNGGRGAYNCVLPPELRSNAATIDFDQPTRVSTLFALGDNSIQVTPDYASRPLVRYQGMVATMYWPTGHLNTWSPVVEDPLCPIRDYARALQVACAGALGGRKRRDLPAARNNATPIARNANVNHAGHVTTPAASWKWKGRSKKTPML